MSREYKSKCCKKFKKKSRCCKRCPLRACLARVDTDWTRKELNKEYKRLFKENCPSI